MNYIISKNTFLVTGGSRKQNDKFFLLKNIDSHFDSIKYFPIPKQEISVNVVKRLSCWFHSPHMQGGSM